MDEKRQKPIFPLLPPNSNFTWFLVTLPFNCSGFNATFTSLRVTGKEGPKDIGNHYTGQDHDGQVKMSRGIQQWTVPFTGQYRIETVGASGGYDTESSTQYREYRGRGARMAGTFNLSKGEIIQILVGQEGGIRNNGRGSGGAGGTFVVRGNNTPLIVAGGGGGLRAVISRHQGCDANTNTSGNRGHKSWPGGSDGNGGMAGINGHSVESDENNYKFISPKSVADNTHLIRQQSIHRL